MNKLIKKSGALFLIIGFFMGGVPAAFAENIDDPATQKGVTEAVTNQDNATEQSQDPTSSTEDSAKGKTEETTVGTATTDTIEEGQITKEETADIVKSVDTLIDETVGKPEGDPIDLDAEHTASSIRAQLEKDDYGITKTELDNYSDKQLEDALTLFTRYNFDIAGMDLSSYVRLLTTLYVDKTVSLDKALAQLNFDPASFSSFSAMIPQVEALLIYLNTLYPVNSSFLSGKSFTSEELVTILTYLDTFETKVHQEGGQLVGRIIYILNAKDYVPNGGTNESSSNLAKETPDNSTPQSKASEDKKKAKFGLPQTGEQKARFAILILGLVIVIGAVVAFISKKKKTK